MSDTQSERMVAGSTDAKRDTDVSEFELGDTVFARAVGITDDGEQVEVGGFARIVDGDTEENTLRLQFAYPGHPKKVAWVTAHAVEHVDEEYPDYSCRE